MKRKIRIKSRNISNPGDIEGNASQRGILNKNLNQTEDKMYKSRIFTVVFFVMMFFAGSMAIADSPSLITYQGILWDNTTDEPITNSTQSVVFSLWSEEEDGEELWAETHSDVTTNRIGAFTVTLGSQTADGLTKRDFDDISLWLQIQVESDDPMEPRIQLTAVPYAIRAGGAWSLAGNSDLVGGSNFLGTTDQTALTFKVNNQKVMRLSPPPDDGNPYDNSPNIVAGHYNNQVTEDIDGATIGGGGLLTLNGDLRNKISQNLGTIGGGADNKVNGVAGTVGGGWSNTAGGQYSTVPGGKDCKATADYSFAAGYQAKAQHNGSFVWGDATDQIVASTGENQFKIRASNGVIVGGGVDGKVKVQDADGTTAVELDAANHVVRLKNSSGNRTILQDGEEGTIKLYASDDAADETIRLNAESGAITTEILRITGGSDLAEPFMMTDNAHLPEGAVIVIDEDNPGRTTLSNKPYDHRVAGIISGAGDVKPGLTLCQQGVLDGGQQVALTGRVYCQVSACNGAIKPGDMLTTSNIPGHAMKATDRNLAYGAVIGKAMTSLDSGEGLVLVLVNLQ
jgi:hypothetical protein